MEINGSRLLNLSQVHYHYPITPNCMKAWGDLRYNLRRTWGGARVVEWDSLENYCGLRSTEGSNPSLPAEKTLKV